MENLSAPKPGLFYTETKVRHRFEAYSMVVFLLGNGSIAHAYYRRLRGEKFITVFESAKLVAEKKKPLLRPY